jgi:hypothetical protein
MPRCIFQLRGVSGFAVYFSYAVYLASLYISATRCIWLRCVFQLRGVSGFAVYFSYAVLLVSLAILDGLILEWFKRAKLGTRVFPERLFQNTQDFIDYSCHHLRPPEAHEGI